MKQQKSFNLKMLLIAVLALVMAFALVACNNDKKNNNNENNSDNSDNVEMSDEMKQLVEESRADIDAMFNYFLTRSETITAEEEVLSFSVEFINSGAGNRGSVYYNFEGRVAVSNLTLRPSGMAIAKVYVFENDNYAKNFETKYMTAKLDPIRIGKKVIEHNTLYQQILGSTRPASITKFTKEQVNLMESKLHRGVNNNEAMCVVGSTIYNRENLGTVVWRNRMLKGNCNTEEGVVKTDSSIEDIIKGEKIRSANYTDDSYVTLDEATGLMSYKLTDRLGWHIREILDSNGNPTGKYEADGYFYNEVPTTIVIPTKIGDYDIDEASTQLDDDVFNRLFESVVIEKAISKVSLYGNIKQITIPMSDEAFVGVDFNTALETINFGGTTQQWEELYGNKAQGWTHAHYDYGDKYVDITFTVNCTNGSITYPKTNT